MFHSQYTVKTYGTDGTYGARKQKTNKDEYVYSPSCHNLWRKAIAVFRNSFVIGLIGLICQIPIFTKICKWELILFDTYN